MTAVIRDKTRRRPKRATPSPAGQNGRTRADRGRPKINPHGTYRSGVRAIEIPLPAKTKIKVQLLIVHDGGAPDGEHWRIGWSFDGRKFHSRAMPSVRGPYSPTEDTAILAGLRICSDRLQMYRRTSQSASETAQLTLALETIEAEITRRNFPDSATRNGAGGKPKRDAASSPGTALATIPPAAIAEPTAMSAAEQKRLAKAERVIAENLKSFVEVGVALATIQRDRLYRVTNDSFEQYVRERWDIGRQYAYRLIEAAKLATQLEEPEAVSPIGDKRRPKPTRPPVVPQSESQVRPLLRVDEDQRREVWQEAVARAEARGKPAPTAAIVEEAVRDWITPGDELEKRRNGKSDSERSANASPGAGGIAKARNGESAKDAVIGDPPPRACPDPQGWHRTVNELRERVFRALEGYEDWPNAWGSMARALRMLAGELEGYHADAKGTTDGRG